MEKNGALVDIASASFGFDDSLKITSISFFIPGSNFLGCKLNNFTFKVLYWVILYWYYIEPSQISLSSWNFSNVFKCFYIISNRLIKTFLPSIWLSNVLFLPPENIVCVLLRVLHFQMIIHIIFLLLDNLD